MENKVLKILATMLCVCDNYIIMLKNLKRIILISATITAIFFLSANRVLAAPIEIINTTDTPNQGENATLGAFGNTALAQSFFVGPTGGEVTSLVIQDAYVNPFTTNHNVKIYTGIAEGVIGSPLVSFDANATGSNGLLTFAPTSTVILDAATMYWVVVKSTDSITWKYSNTVNSGSGTIPETMYRARSTDDGATWSYDEGVNAGGGFGTGAWNFNMRVFVNPPFSIEPTAVSQIQRTSATLEGRFENPSWDTNNPDITAELGLAIGTSSGFDIENSVSVNTVNSTTADESGYYSIPFSSLTCGTEYYAKAYLRVYDENPGGENRLYLFGETSTTETTFTTDPCFTVGMDNVSDITQTSATLRALIQNIPFNSLTELRFYVDTAEDFGSENSFMFQAESMDEGGYYSAAIPTENALTCGTTYYAMAEVYAHDEEETWSETVASSPYSFTTANCDPVIQQQSLSTSSGGYNMVAHIQWLSQQQKQNIDNKTCPTGDLLTQNLKTGARNGKYNSYTGGVVNQAHILQKHLNRLGFSSGKEDGILGRVSDGAIKRMQTYLGTKADGLVGPITRGLINNSCGVNGLQKS